MEFRPAIVFAKSTILDVGLGFAYVSVMIVHQALQFIILKRFIILQNVNHLHFFNNSGANHLRGIAYS